MINIENAKKVSGWTSELEIAWLAEQASHCKRVVEIGAWMGRSTRAMADNLPPGGVIYAVDTWRGTKEDGHYKQLQGKPEDWLLNEFQKNIGEALFVGPEHIVRALQLPSIEAAKYLGTECYKLSFDMIFIDAAHDYDNVKADILAWRPLLAPGGLLCGHDFDAGRAGVVRAVRELIHNPRRAPGSIWYQDRQA